jgi:hypothetical protein
MQVIIQIKSNLLHKNIVEILFVGIQFFVIVNSNKDLCIWIGILIIE